MLLLWWGLLLSAVSCQVLLFDAGESFRLDTLDMSWIPLGVNSPALFRRAARLGYVAVSFGGNRLCTVDQSGFETVVTSSGPSSRSSVAITVVNDEDIYIFGGAEGNVVFDEFWRFDINIRLWTRLQLQGGISIPRRQGAMMEAVGEQIYLYGGCSDAGTLRDFYRIDSRSLVGHVIQSFSSPPPLCHSVSVVIGTSIYMHGGTGDLVGGQTMYEFDTVAQQWSVLASNGPRRAFHMGAAVGPVIYIFGGTAIEGCQADLFTFDIRTRHWAMVLPNEPWPLGRCAGWMVAFPDEKLSSVNSTVKGVVAQ